VRQYFPTSSESSVRYYCRAFPVVFNRARGAEIFDADGARYIDFLAGSGALNYGHNHPRLKQAIADYLGCDGILQSLDLHTEAKARFIARFDDAILRPRHMEYKFQFTGPTGTNAVEAALKLARKVTHRSRVVAFTGAFHGVTMGSLALTSSAAHRSAAGRPLDGTIRMPFEGFVGSNDELAFIERMLMAPGAGEEPPAAFVVETVQGEGLACASGAWLRHIQRIARSMGALLIVDDIFAGCGRTGTFFSFEDFGIEPDIVCLSKSIGGIGLPMALVLIRPDCDVWKPGEHNGTFRGNNLAFVAATAALDFWQDPTFLAGVQAVIRTLDSELSGIVKEFGEYGVRTVGRGALRGIDVEEPEVAASVQAAAFRGGLIFERCGATDSVLKFLPPLNIPIDLLREAMAILTQALRATFTADVAADGLYDAVHS
jgi:diaminobutyrate-2-oxoglutarate transaminase